MKKVQCRSAEAHVHSNGIIEVYMNPAWDQPDTPETARECAMMLKGIVGDGIFGLMSFPPNLYIKKDVLKAYLEVPIGHSADAFVVKSFGARLLGKIALNFYKNPNPIQLFGSKEEAQKWLLEQLEIARSKS